MDPFTDMLGALATGRVAPFEIVLWLIEWAEYGAEPAAICSPEVTAQGCAAAHIIADTLAHLLGILTD